MDSNAGIRGRRVVGMGWLWMVCFFHLVSSLEGKNRFYIMQQLNKLFFRRKPRCASQYAWNMSSVSYLVIIS